nr:odorant receptor 85b-like [Leptinotarsa decemlineata]
MCFIHKPSNIVQIDIQNIERFAIRINFSSSFQDDNRNKHDSSFELVIPCFVADEHSHFTSIIESAIGGSALLSVIYVSTCFILKKKEIKRLIDSLKIFEDYLPEDEIDKAEKSAKFYTKTFLFYGIIGNGLYESSPFMSFKECRGERTQQMIKLGIPCKVIVRYVLPFKYDTTPFYELVILEQVAVAILGTILVMTISMLVCGILTHIASNLSYLKKIIEDISRVEEPQLKDHVNLCIKYHTIILEISDKTNNAFEGMMLIHITWTSFIISVLGFGIIMESNFWNNLRFVMHLGGWLMMLFLVCFYGQILMDKSTDISEAIYGTKWYEKNPNIRRALTLLLLRSQRPLVLKAAGLRIMSLSTFLGVLYSAYSYFTLLLKIKP